MEIPIKKMTEIQRTAKYFAAKLKWDSIQVWGGRPPYRYFDVNSIITSHKYF